MGVAVSGTARRGGVGDLDGRDQRRRDEVSGRGADGQPAHPDAAGADRDGRQQGAGAQAAVAQGAQRGQHGVAFVADRQAGDDRALADRSGLVADPLEHAAADESVRAGDEQEREQSERAQGQGGDHQGAAGPAIDPAAGERCRRDAHQEAHREREAGAARR